MPININSIMTSFELTSISNERNLSTRRTRLSSLQRNSGYSFNRRIRNYVLGSTSKRGESFNRH